MRLFKSLILFLAVSLGFSGVLQAQTAEPKRPLDIFMGVDFNYRDIFITNNRVYDLLIYLTPGAKWNLGNGWMAAGQVLIPVVNNYGDYYKKIRPNMAVISKELYTGQKLFTKVSGGLFGRERYGLDVKSMFLVNDWFAFEAQVGLTGFCSMAVDWDASYPKRVTYLVGGDIYLKQWNTQFRGRVGRFQFADYGAIGECMRHFKHCSVGLYAQYSKDAIQEWNGGFKVVMMIPPYTRKHKKVNFRPASNFRFTYNMEADMYSNKMYTTDPEENEREGWFDRDKMKWGSNTMAPDFKTKE